MSYNKTVWENGDVVTPENLNNIEQGIVNIPQDNCAFYIEYVYDDNNDTLILNKTAREIYSAINLNKLIVLVDHYSEDWYDVYTYFPLIYYVKDNNSLFNVFSFGFNNDSNTRLTFFTNDIDEYPSNEEISIPENDNYSGLIFLKRNNDGYTFNKTASEVKNALDNNIPVVGLDPDGQFIVIYNYEYTEYGYNFYCIWDGFSSNTYYSIRAQNDNDALQDYWWD